MNQRPRIALIAHDVCKDDLGDWALFNCNTLERCDVIATGTTGERIAKLTGLHVERLLSGPLGGDAQTGALLAEGKVDLLVFFWDPLKSQPHDVDVKALLRLAVLYNVPTACNRSSADFLISSPLFFDMAHRLRRRSDERVLAEAV
jgi:methylglyoxal synthase